MTGRRREFEIQLPRLPTSFRYHHPGKPGGSFQVVTGQLPPALHWFLLAVGSLQEVWARLCFCAPTSLFSNPDFDITASFLGLELSFVWVRLRGSQSSLEAGFWHSSALWRFGFLEAGFWRVFGCSWCNPRKPQRGGLQNVRSLAKPSPTNEHFAVSGAMRADSYTGYTRPVAPAFQRAPPSLVLGSFSLVAVRFGSGALDTFPRPCPSEDREFRIKLSFEFAW